MFYDLGVLVPFVGVINVFRRRCVQRSGKLKPRRGAVVKNGQNHDNKTTEHHQNRKGIIIMLYSGARTFMDIIGKS